MFVRRAPHPSSLACAAVYAVLALAVFVEKVGRTTSDTRLDLTENASGFLMDSLTLWNPRVSLGELQNQAYGYLFPQGLYFAGADAAGVVGWVSERAWSVIVLVLACEGVRRLACAMMLNPWGAAVAGLFYGLSPRIVAEIGVRSAEMLPTAIIPWALLPIVHAATGRRGYRSAALLSGAAFAFSGGVNGTATLAPLPIVGIFVVWMVLRRDVPWTFLLWWGGVVAAVSAWWLVSLLTLGRYSPPFFDYVEDAQTTTTTTGFAPSMRGASNWVNYIVVGDSAWWPSGHDVSLNPWIVLGSGLVAAAGLVGLARYRGVFQAPLLVSVTVGLTGLVIAHTGDLTSPVSPYMQDLLDGALAPFRNVQKIDPLLRVPLAVGLAAMVGEVLAAARRDSPVRRFPPAARRALGVASVTVLVLSLAAMSWPIMNGNLRTPGWKEFPDYWTAAAKFVDEQEGDGAAWIVPGAGFGIETWGWTMEEPMQVIGDAPWVTRSQVPLTPASSIRMLSSLEALLETGSGSPYLGDMLVRVGVEHIVVRHDLDPDVSESTLSSLVSIALARSSGIEKVAQFGRVDFGPAIEIFEVEGGDQAGFAVRDTNDTVTVASGVEDVMAAVGAGMVDHDQAVMVRGESGWDEPADVVGDGYRLRERNFGRVHDSESYVLRPDEPLTQDRVVSNYPGAPGAVPVVARYQNLASVRASTSAGDADVLGPVRPENAAFAALDGDPGTRWESAYLTKPEDQWLELDVGRERPLPSVRISTPPNDLGAAAVRKWRVLAGDEEVVATVNPFTGVAVADLDDVVTDRLRFEVLQAGRPGSRAQVAVSEIEVPGFEFGRTMQLPEVPAPDPHYVFASRPETRSCIPTLLGPDCSAFRERASEESTGIDRTFTVEADGNWTVRGLAVARSRPGAARLLDPLAGMTATASSWLGTDPTVSARMSYDGDTATSWIADPRDRSPSLTFTWPEKQVIREIGVSRPVDPGARPTRAVLRAGSEVRIVDLNGDGTLSTPLNAAEVTVTFSRPGDPTYTTLGVGDVYFGAKRYLVPLDGAGRTGSVCGFGPRLLVDGVPFQTRVDGFIGDVVAAGQMAVHLCGEGPLQLTAGEHRVRLESTEQFQPVSLQLIANPRTPATSSRRIELESSGKVRQVLRVSGGEEAVVSVPRNFNDGWVAELEGERLQPLQVDGWSQGWLVPADASGELVVTFAPQDGYRRNLFAGLVVLGGVLLAAAAVGLWRRARATPTPPDRRDWWARSRRGWAVLLAVAAFVVGGPVVLAGAVLALALRSRPLVVQSLAAVALLTGAVIAAAAVAGSQGLPPDLADLVTGFGVAMLLVSASLLHRVIPGHVAR